MDANKHTVTAGTKRKLDEITAEVPTQEQEEVEEPPQQPQPLTPTSTSTPPQRDLPSGLDLESPYAILIHFIGQEIFQRISRSTNEHAQQNQSSTDASRTWKETSIDEIKVYFGLLIYMSVHISPRLSYYWNTNEQEGPLHPSRHYMGQKRFEQIKRYLRIPLPDTEQAGENEQPGASSTSPNTTITRVPSDNGDEEESNSPAAIHEIGFASRDRSSHKIYGKSRSQFPEPLPYSFLEESVIKAWRIQHTHKKQQGAKGNKLPCQREFRSKLYKEIFEFAFARYPRPQPEVQKHRRVQLPGNSSEKTIRRICVFCHNERKQSKVKLPGRAGSSSSGCLECGNVPLCLKTKCWEKWHNSAN